MGSTKVWRAGDWQRLMEISQSRPIKVGWLKGHFKKETSAVKWHRQVDDLAHIHVVSNDGDYWERLAECLHIKRDPSDKAELYYKFRSWGWSVSMTTYETIISVCLQYRIKLKVNHPNLAPSQHICHNKNLWNSWQVDYVGPCKLSHGKKYVLVGIEVVSGLTMATVTRIALGTLTMEVLEHWFSILPMPEYIQSDNGLHFTATSVQD